MSFLEDEKKENRKPTLKVQVNHFVICLFIRKLDPQTPDPGTVFSFLSPI